MTVTGGSALGKDEIDRMMKDAEAHEEADRKRRESVEMRNEADALAFRTEKVLDENGDKIPEDVKTPVVDSLTALKEALKGTDNDDAVKAAMEDLNQKASAMGQAVYQASQAEQAAAAAQDASADGDAPNWGADDATDDGVVDAEIVDDENDKN